MKSKQHIAWLEVNDSESKASGHMPQATGTGDLLCTNKSYLKKVEQEVLRFCLNAALQIHKIHTLYNKIKIFLELGNSDLIVDLLVTSFCSIYLVVDFTKGDIVIFCIAS
jgi:uncharacterized protein (DUF111 family)